MSSLALLPLCLSVAAAPPSKDFWSFRPPVAAAVPETRDRTWPRNEVDRFLLVKLEETGLRPAVEADRTTLFRRLSFALTGLPPSIEALDAFLQDGATDAYERVVERFLASPRFGERFGRYWLDVARYADTKGYTYGRDERRFVHSHVYRDWVIGAYNRDLPYDRFVSLQIAADRLVGPNDDPRDLAAMGFLTLNRSFIGVVHDIIDDRIDVLLRGTQGLTGGCARCHDHKFDPISMADYYGLYGIFANSLEKTVPAVAPPERTSDFLSYESELQKREAKLRDTLRQKREALSERLRAKTTDYLVAVLDVEKLPTEDFYSFIGLEDLNPTVVRAWQAYLFQTAKAFHRVFAPWHALERLRGAEFSDRAPGEIARFFVEGAQPLNPPVAAAFRGAAPASMVDVAKKYGALLAEAHHRWAAALAEAKTAGREPPAALEDASWEELRAVLYGPGTPCAVPDAHLSEIEWWFDEATRVEISKLHGEIDKWLIESPGAPPHAVLLVDRPQPKPSRVFLRGNPATRGAEAPRQYIDFLSEGIERPFQDGSGRAELGRAIASPRNPLTARVMVNRVWLWLFGFGLVRTPSDFGMRSEPPEHRELLDWLAVRFMEEGWSVKALVRRLVLSNAYRSSSATSDINLRADPEGRLLSRFPRARLDYEALRDALLSASGELDLAMGGRAVDLEKSSSAFRRSVYGTIDRQYLPAVLRVFDYANPDLHSPQRFTTTVPQQGLYLMNSPFVLDRARKLAAHLTRDRADDGERVRLLYRLALRREASPQEHLRAVAFLAGLPVESEPPPPPTQAAWSYGFARFDASTQRTADFTPLPHFTGDSWQGGAAWPDSALGWVRVTNLGGHPGNDPAHASLRRWTAPRDLVAAIRGKLKHAAPEGDGVAARIVSSRGGLLWSANVHNTEADSALSGVELRAGDTLDFLVDIGGTLAYDDYLWSPAIEAAPEAAAVTKDTPRRWDARADFAGGAATAARPLTPLELLAQALLLSNEFAYVD